MSAQPDIWRMAPGFGDWWRQPTGSRMLHWAPGVGFFSPANSPGASSRSCRVLGHASLAITAAVYARPTMVAQTRSPSSSLGRSGHLRTATLTPRVWPWLPLGCLGELVLVVHATAHPSTCLFGARSAAHHPNPQPLPRRPLQVISTFAVE